MFENKALTIYNIIDGKWFVHFQVIPEFRKECADLIAIESLEWYRREIDEWPLFAEIPDEYENVARFAIKHGFKKIGNYYQLEG